MVTAGAPILGLVALVIVGAFAVFIDFANQQDRGYVEDSRRLVSNTLEGRLRALSDITLDFASWNDAYNAISLHWNQEWIGNNFYSAVTDGLIIFRADGTVRYHWLAEPLQGEATTLPGAAANAARALPSLAALPRAPTAAGTVTRTLVMLDGRLALLSVAPIAPDDNAARLRRPSTAPVDYLAAFNILDARQIGPIGTALDLHGLSVRPAPASPDSDAVSLPLHGSNGATIGVLQWRNERPGSAAFAGEIGPVLLGLLIIGALSFLVARFLVLRQVTIATRAEAALESSRLKSEFISNMSHELRTPLNAIIGYAELIEEEAPRGAAWEALRQDVDYITEAATKLHQFINDVIDHSRIDAGRLQLAPEPIRVCELLAEVEDLLAPAARANDNSFTATAENEALSLTADHQRLRQCLINLAGNAIKFTRGGSVSIAASSERVDSTPYVLFEIRDNGIGIADAAALFEPFKQSNDPMQLRDRGAGLGLSMSRRLARAMGGDITCVSAPGAGSCFSLRVPVNATAQLATAA